MMNHSILKSEELNAFRRHPFVIIKLIFCCLVVVTLLALGTGAVVISPITVVEVMGGFFGLPVFGFEATPIEENILINIRFPRIAMSLMAGSLLAVTGVFMQAFFRNPLADPALIGVAAGGALGAVSMIVLGVTFFAGLTQVASMFALPLAAFTGSLLVSVIVFIFARQNGSVNATTMLLCGIAINAMAGAGIGLLSFVADDAQLRDLTFWSLGSLGAATWWHAGPVFVAFIVTILSIPFLKEPLNALLLGDNEAIYLGYNVEKLKVFLLILTCVAAGAVVSTCGVIGFIGLIAPHLSRLIIGPDHKYVLPLSTLLGGLLLTSADMIARTIVAPAELPIGILTALIGGPIFLILLRQRKEGGFNA